MFRFGYSGVEYFTFFNYSCAGNELTLSSCDALGIVNCITSDVDSAVAALCDGDATMDEVETKVNEVL